MKYVSMLTLVGMGFTLLQSCVSAHLPSTVTWNDVSVELPKTPGAVIKEAAIDGNEQTGIVITGLLEITKPRISGGGHVDLILSANDSEVVILEGTSYRRK